MAKIKRSQIKTFMDITPSSTATYKLISDGVTTGKINMNPKTTEETYIGEDSATITVDSYAPTMPVGATAVSGMMFLISLMVYALLVRSWMTQRQPL